MSRASASLASRLGTQFTLQSWPRLRRFLMRLRRPARFGSLGSARPLSGAWGFDRGTPVDRYYIERFLSAHRDDIRGRVLEVKNAAYTRGFGTGVLQAEVLDVEPSNPSATIIADLSAAESVEGAQFDCFILTQTLQFIYDTRAALAHAHRLLVPGGVLLVTVPSVSRLAPSNGLTGEYWRFAPAACRRLFEEVFGAGQVEIVSYGNVTSAIAFLAGAAREELRSDQLDAHDEYFPVVVGIRARRSFTQEQSRSSSSSDRDVGATGTSLGEQPPGDADQ